MSSELPVDKYLTINGLKFHYLDWGSSAEKKPDMLLLHGLSGHAHFWDAFARSMKEQYRVLALDQRGHGDSEWPKDGYGAEQYASDIAGFVEQLGLDQFVLIGLSLGGRTAMTYASDHSAKLDKLVIVDMGPAIDPRGGARIAAGQRAFPDTFDSHDEVLAFARIAYPGHTEELGRMRMHYGTRQREDGKYEWKYDRLGLMRAREQNPAPDLWEPIKRIACPTLVVRGDASDVLARDVALRMVETIPNCRLIEVSSGHSIPGENPAGFEAAVRGFLGG